MCVWTFAGWCLSVPVCAYVSGFRLSARVMDWTPGLSLLGASSEQQQSGPVGDTALTGNNQLEEAA